MEQTNIAKSLLDIHKRHWIKSSLSMFMLHIRFGKCELLEINGNQIFM